MFLKKILDWLGKRSTSEPDDQKVDYTNLDTELEDDEDRRHYFSPFYPGKGEIWYHDDEDRF